MSLVDKLFEQHAADPRNLELRRVLADALAEAGDPRGEFIHTQLAIAAGNTDPALAHRAEELRRTHQNAWNVPNAMAIRRFERGFLVDASCTMIDELALASLEWATVERLVVDHIQCGLAPILARMPFLHCVLARGLEDLATERGPFPQIRALGLRDRSVLRDTKAFPNLEVVGRGWRDRLELPDAPVHVHIGTWPNKMRDLIMKREDGCEEVRYVVGEAMSVVFEQVGWIVAVPRTGVRARLSWSPAPDEPNVLREVLRLLADAGLRELSVHTRRPESVEQAMVNLPITADFTGTPVDLFGALPST